MTIAYEKSKPTLYRQVGAFARNSLPRSIAAAASQSPSSVLTQSGTGTVRM